MLPNRRPKPWTPLMHTRGKSPKKSINQSINHHSICALGSATASELILRSRHRGYFMHHGIWTTTIYLFAMSYMLAARGPWIYFCRLRVRFFRRWWWWHPKSNLRLLIVLHSPDLPNHAWWQKPSTSVAWLVPLGHRLKSLERHNTEVLLLS